MNDNNTIEEKIRKEKLKETTVSIDPHAAKPGPAILLPRKYVLPCIMESELWITVR